MQIGGHTEEMKVKGYLEVSLNKKGGGCSTLVREKSMLQSPWQQGVGGGDPQLGLTIGSDFDVLV